MLGSKYVKRNINFNAYLTFLILLCDKEYNNSYLLHIMIRHNVDFFCRKNGHRLMPITT